MPRFRWRRNWRGDEPHRTVERAGEHGGQRLKAEGTPRPLLPSDERGESSLADLPRAALMFVRLPRADMGLSFQGGSLAAVGRAWRELRIELGGFAIIIHLNGLIYHY